jgi:hypothetical protein
MKPLLIAFAVVLVAGGGLAIMNKACKSGYHDGALRYPASGTT